MHYRLYTSEDFSSLYAIEELCFLPPFRFERSYMRKLVRRTNAVTWIAEDEGQLAGFSIVEWEKDEGEIIAYIQTIEVHPQHRGAGMGGELLRCMEGSALQAGACLIWLHVDAENSAAIRLYEARGYLLEGREENYYPQRRAAVIFKKKLEA